MPKTLYIQTHTEQSEKDDFLTYMHQNLGKETENSFFVYIPDGLSQQNHVGKHGFIIQEHEKFSDNNSTLDPISYRDLLGLIFLSDGVLVM